MIDDDDSSNFINKRIIEKAGITDVIETTLNGQEALDFLTNSGKYEKAPGHPFPQPMLILLDINMPVMDGWEFLEAYQKLPENQKSKIIIVMLTTSLNPDDNQRAMQISDISGFRNKPLTLEIIDDIMKIHFSDYL